MGSKTVSVVMATYNGSKYIREQLRSISDQTVLPDEIIISDDGSSDDTLNIIESFRQECSIKIVVIQRRDRAGFRDNFLVASREAQGDFIAFCDQDDIWKDNKIEKCSKYFNDPAISMIVHSATTIDQTSKEIGEFRQGIRNTRIAPPLSYDPWGTFWGFSIVFRRELLNLYSIEDRFLDYISPKHRIAHDRWIVFLGQIVGSTAEISEPLVKYRQHDNNVFGQGSGSKISTTDDIRGRSAVYIEATLKMVEIARAMTEASAENFPLYDKQKSVDFFESALAQLRARHAIYLSETKIKALKAACLLTAKGGYRGVDGGQMRWKSFVRDLQFAVTRS